MRGLLIPSWRSIVGPAARSVKGQWPRRPRSTFLAGLEGALVAAATASVAWTQAELTTRVSVDSDGNEANEHSRIPSISFDGRYVAFESKASNLVPGDTNGFWDVFVKDRRTGQTTRVSVSSDGGEANDWSFGPSISGDGRYVAFQSNASNLVAGDTNWRCDVFVHDRSTGQTARVSVDSNGNQALHHSYSPSISADGRYVVFWSSSPNLVPGDTNTLDDVFVHDRTTGQTVRVSVNSNGIEGSGESRCQPGALSADGRYVAFESWSDLVDNDTNSNWDVFVRDRVAGTTTRASFNPPDVNVAGWGPGLDGNNPSWHASISADGRYVAFQSLASNFVPGDTNGNWDVFVHDRTTLQMTRVSVHSQGKEANGDSDYPSVSSDGFVAFESLATNLVSGDTNGFIDLFVHDLATSKTSLVSVDTCGNQGDGNSRGASSSSTGHFVSFWSVADNLVENDTLPGMDVFVREVVPTGVPYCFGDGSGSSCGCGNTGGPGQGCANSSGSGATLDVQGSPCVQMDDLLFRATQLLPSQPALLFVGLNAVNGGSGVVFGSGLRCAGGGVVRLGVESPSATGGAAWGPGLGGAGGWDAGDTRYFQVWYRDPAGLCGAWNLTNGLEVVFRP